MLNTLIFETTNAFVFVLITPFIGVLILLCIPLYNNYMLKTVALGVSCAVYLISLFLWILSNKSTGSFQFANKILWIAFFNFNFSIGTGIDGISLFFILLTTLLIFLCVLISWTSITMYIKEFLISFLVLEFFLIGVFCILDLLLFFRSILIPMYLIIGIWGPRERKIKAAYFFYTYFVRFCLNASFYYIYLLPSREYIFWNFINFYFL